MGGTQVPQDSGCRRKDGSEDMYLECSRVARELKMPQDPIEIAMGKAIDWFQKTRAQEEDKNDRDKPSG